MDTRLWTISHLRPEALRRPDLPNVARAIVGYMRGMVKLHTGHVRETTYVLFQANAFQALVRGEDWAKILPYLKDDTLSPPPEPLKPGTPGYVSVANIDVYDAYYYGRVLGVLQGLFTQDFPTSKL